MLDTNTAEAQLLSILDDQATRLDDPAKARRDLARDLVGVMANLIRTGTVTGTVSTTGTAAAQSGTILTSKIA